MELEGSGLSHDKCCDLCAVTAPNPMPMCGVDALSCVLVLAASVGLIFFRFFFNSSPQVFVFPSCSTPLGTFPFVLLFSRLPCLTSGV